MIQATNFNNDLYFSGDAITIVGTDPTEYFIATKPGNYHFELECRHPLCKEFDSAYVDRRIRNPCRSESEYTSWYLLSYVIC